MENINFNLKPNDYTFGSQLNEELRNINDNFEETDGKLNNLENYILKPDSVKTVHIEDLAVTSDKLAGDISESKLDTALKAKVNQGKIAGIITTTLPSTGIVTDKVYEFAGVQGVPITGGTIKDTNGATITTLQNGDSVWYNPSTEFWYRIPFQSLANYPTKDDIYETGKNKFNLNDAEVLRGKYLGANGTLYTYASYSVTHYIPILAGQSIICNTAYAGADPAHWLFDTAKNRVAIVTGSKIATATVDGYVRFTLNINSLGDLGTTQAEIGTISTSYQSYQIGFDPLKILQVNESALPSNTEKTITTITKTFKRLGTSGVDADYCGINAIGDCLAAITDASYYKRYKLIGEGFFLFSQTSDFVYKDVYNEWSIIDGKDYCDIEGYSKDSLVLAVELPDNLSINYGMYQPIAWNCNSTLKNCTVIAKNCRYAVHFEGGTLVTNSTLNFQNVDIWHKGNYNNAAVSQNGSTAWTTTDAIGSGLRDGQTFNINNCTLFSVQASDFGCHSALGTVTRGANVNLIDCVFKGNRPVTLHNYPVNRNVIVNITNPTYKGTKRIECDSSLTTISKYSDYAEMKVFTDSEPLQFRNLISGKGLRIKSKTTGINSIVTVDSACTAFNSIIGFSDDNVETKTNNNWNKTKGYYYLNGAVGVPGFIIGGVDVNDSTSHTSLGKKLGNCSSVNKTLTVSIDGTSYDIVFTTNCTSLTNTQVITLITDVIGSVADVDTFAVGSEYYPNFKGLLNLTNGDSEAILAGMGVILYDVNKIKIAQNSDGYIDGICLDTIGVGQVGRVITCGELFSYNNLVTKFKTLEVTNAHCATGVQFGISVSQKGYFDRTASPKVLRAVSANVVKIL